ncbi:MAG: AAA family ATPase [Acidimicrobiales bacterium]
MLYPGKVHAINAESESGKTWMALDACAERMLQGEHVVFADFEDSAASVVGRLVSLGVPVDVVEVCFHYIRPDDPLTDDTREALLSLVMDCTASLVILDGVTEAMVLHGFSINDNDDAARFMALLPKPLTAGGAAVVLLDHVTKSKEDRGRFAIGAQHKLAGIDGAVYSATVVEPYGRGRTGTSKLEVAKDRPGHVRAVAGEGKRIGVFRLVADGESLRAEIVPPGVGAQTNGIDPFIDKALAAQIAKVVSAYGSSGVNLADIVETVNRRKAKVSSTLTWLEANDYVHCTRGGIGKANAYRSLRPFAVAEGKPDGDG